MKKQIHANKLLLALVFIHLAVFIIFISTNGNTHRPDTLRYLVLAESVCDTGSFLGPNIRYRTGDVRVTVQKDSYSGHQNLLEQVPEVLRTPGYPIFLCAMEKLGMDSDYAKVGVQLGLFLLSVFLIRQLVKNVFGDLQANLLAMLMLITPGGMVYSLTLYSEVPFLLFFSAALLLCFYYIKNQTYTVLIFSALAFALSFYIKPSVLYLPFLITILFLLFYRKLSRRVIIHAPIFLVIFIMCIAPWLVRNQHHYQTPYISGQLSNMLAIYHLPSVWAESQGMDEIDARLEVRKLVDQKVLNAEAKTHTYLNSVEIFNIQQQYALSELIQYPATYAKQWLYGILESVRGDYSNRLYILLSGEKIPWGKGNESSGNSDQTGILTIAIQTIAKVAVKLERVFWISVFLLAAASLLRGIWKLEPVAFISALCIAFFLFIPGSMGYSRFRFPIEWLMLLYALQSLIALHAAAFSSTDKAKGKLEQAA